MAITIDGAGTITGLDADGISSQPVFAGQVLQVVFVQHGTTLTATNLDTVVFNFEGSITPMFATSKILVVANITGLDNGGAGRLTTQILQDATSGGTTGAQLSSMFVAQNSSSTNGLSSVSTSRLTEAVGSTSTQYIKVINLKEDSSTTWHAQRFGSRSSLTLMEIAG